MGVIMIVGLNKDSSWLFRIPRFSKYCYFRIKPRAGSPDEMLVFWVLQNGFETQGMVFVRVDRGV